MLIFEYTRSFKVLPSSLINEAPAIWRWDNPYMNISDWMFDLYNIEPLPQMGTRFVFTEARLGYNKLVTVESYADFLLTENSFYWDNANQVAYYHLLVNPQAYASMDMAELCGTTYDRPVVFNNIVYPNILKSKPSVEKNAEPLVYQKIGAQTLSIELINDELWGINSTGKPYKYHCFDDTTNINGQTTYLRYGENGETDYTKLKLLHKGIITKLTKTGTRLFLTCDDVRSKRDAEWPTFTFEDAGYTAEQVGEDVLTTVIPDGFGENENIPLVCINHDVSIIPTNEDDEIVEPSDQLLSWNMSTATAVDVLISQRADDKIAKFNSFRIAKTAVNADAKVIMSFTANATRQKITGYIRCDTANVPVGATPIAVYNTAGTVFGEIILQMHNRTYDVNGQRNTRIKYNVAEDGKVTAFFSFETPVLTVGSSYNISIVPDNEEVSASAIVVAGLRVGTVQYPQFRCARRITAEKELVFDGDNDYIALVNNASIMTDILSISLWFKTLASTPYMSLMSTQIGYRLMLNEGKPLCYITQDYSDPFVVYPVIICSTDTKYNDGAWHNIVLTYDETYAHMYLDGVQVDVQAGTATAGVRYDTPSISIGGAFGSLLKNFKGSIKDVRYFGRALNPNEVANITNISGMNAQWALNEQSGTVANDSVGGNTGTIVDAIWQYPLDVYYEKDSEQIKVNTFVDVTLDGIVTLHDVDAHEDGIITNGLRSLYCSATLRPETNPFDIITVLNDEVEGIPYIASFYDIDLCTTEKAKLAPVSLYADGTQKLNAVIEQLQSGSTVGFRYDDVDKIYILCDDPNRPVARVIQSEEIVKKEDLELESDLTLYADEVTINYGVDRKASNPYKERNSDYKQAVLLRYNYTNPLTYESLLVSQSDARNKSIVLLEDLSVVRDKVHVTVHGLSILSDIDLYSIVRVNLQLSSERAFAGWLRMQVIGISVDTDFEFVTLHLRQRDYSEAFGDISGSYGDVSVLGYASVDDSVVVAVGQDETVVGFIEEE